MPAKNRPKRRKNTLKRSPAYHAPIMDKVIAAISVIVFAVGWLYFISR